MTSYGTDLLVILPELIVVAAACLVLALDPITPASRKELLAWLSLGALALCIGLTGGQISVLNVSCVGLQRPGRDRRLRPILETPALRRDRPDHFDVASLSESGTAYISANTMGSSSSPSPA